MKVFFHFCVCVCWYVYVCVCGGGGVESQAVSEINVAINDELFHTI